MQVFSHKNGYQTHFILVADLVVKLIAQCERTLNLGFPKFFLVGLANLPKNRQFNYLCSTI